MYVYMSRLYHHHGVTDDGNIKNTVYGSPLCPGEPDIWRNTLLNFPNGDAMMALNPLPELHQGNIHGHMYVYMSRLCHHHGVTDDGDIKNNVYGSPLCPGKPDIKFMRYTFFYH